MFKMGVFKKVVALFSVLAIMSGLIPAQQVSSMQTVPDFLPNDSAHSNIVNSDITVSFALGYFPVEATIQDGDTDIGFSMYVTAVSNSGSSSAGSFTPPTEVPTVGLPDDEELEYEYLEDEEQKYDEQEDYVTEENEEDEVYETSPEDDAAVEGEGDEVYETSPESDTPADNNCETSSYALGDNNAEGEFASNPLTIASNFLSGISLGAVRVYAAEYEYTPANEMSVVSNGLGELVSGNTDVELWWYQNGVRRADKGVVSINASSVQDFAAPTKVDLNFDVADRADSGTWTLRAYNGANYVQSPYALNLQVGSYLSIMPISGTIRYVYDEASLAIAWATPGSITIVLTDSFTMGGMRTVANNRHVTIISDGLANHTVTAANNARHFFVQNFGTLTLGVAGDTTASGNNFTLQGQGLVSDHGGSISLTGSVSGNTGGILNMYGGTITGNTSNGMGGALHFAGAARFYMHGGMITGNTSNTTSSAGGGGVVLTGISTFNMHGGVISNNIVANGGGGGVGSQDHATNGVTFNMFGGEIYYNHSLSTNDNHGGGGVFIQGAGSTFTMSGNAIIHYNTASRGGGVRIRPSGSTNANFTMNGGTISYNTASASGTGGGGVHLGVNTTLNMNNGAMISHNTAHGNGGGIAVSSSSSQGATINMNSGSTIYNNEALGTLGGGGVFLQGARSVFTVETLAAVRGNTANFGGGVRTNIAGQPTGGAPGAIFNLNGGAIEDNTALTTGTGGGGVHLNIDTIFNMQSGAIRNNTAYGNGGGVAGSSSARGIEFNMTGGEIYNNRAAGDLGGGGVILQGATSVFTMSNGAVIRENHALHGGGMRINAGTLDMNGGQIRENTTNTIVNDRNRIGRGGGVMVHEGTFNLSGGTVSGNTAGTFGGGVNLNSVNGEFNMTGGSIAGNTAANGGGLGFNIPATIDHVDFIPLLERVTIGTAAEFSGNEATSGFSISTELRDMFIGYIHPGTVTNGSHAFTNHDIHMPTEPVAIHFIVIDEEGTEIELELNRITGIAPGYSFNHVNRINDFPEYQDVRDEVDYTAWDNEFGFGFNEWNFGNRWRVGHPTTGQLIDLEATPVSFDITVADTLRLYAYFDQLLIADDAALREAVSRTSAGVPAELVMQDSFDAEQATSVIIPTGHSITIAARDGDNFTYFRSIGNNGYDQATQRHFVVEDGAMLRLNNITIQGNYPVTNTRHGGVLVEGSGTLYVNAGTVIENNRAIYGGGVFIRAPLSATHGDLYTQPEFGGGGNVFIDGAAIRNNRAENFGGGINATGFVIDHPTFDLPARPSEQLVTITIRGNTEISGNTSRYGGGGAMAQHFARIIMENGTIRDNDTGGWGGGVRFHNGGSFTMHNGTITNNTANYGGGGVGSGGGAGGGGNFELMPGTARFYMNGGSISYNRATGVVLPDYIYSSFLGGGGVMVDGFVVFTMNGGEIYENSAPTTQVPTVFEVNPFGMGGGVFLNHGATFIINNGAVRDNNAYRGGGIHVATVELQPGYELAAHQRTRLYLYDAGITGNTATENGGGIFATYYTNVFVSDRIIFNNNRAVSLHSFFMYPTFGTTFEVSAGHHSAEGQGGFARWSNVDWATVSVLGTHVLNNYDINFIFSPSPPDKFLRVVFNPNGGQFTGSDQLPIRIVEFDGTYELAFNADDNLVNYALYQPTRSGYIFGGWFTSEIAANNLDSEYGQIWHDDEHTNVDMRMLWARWIPDDEYENGGYENGGTPPNGGGSGGGFPGTGIPGRPFVPSTPDTPAQYQPNQVWTQDVTTPVIPAYSVLETPAVLYEVQPELTVVAGYLEQYDELYTIEARANPQTEDNLTMRGLIIAALGLVIALLTLIYARRKNKSI